MHSNPIFVNRTGGTAFGAQETRYFKKIRGAGIDQSQHGNLFVRMKIDDCDWQPRAGSVILT
jgi:hypothetical protein